MENNETKNTEAKLRKTNESNKIKETQRKTQKTNKN